MRVAKGLLAVVVSATVIACASTSQAQQAGVFEVVIPDTSLNLPVSPGLGFGTLGQFQAGMFALANDSICTSVDLTSATSTVVMQLGLPGQPAACSTDGAKVTFVNGRCQPMSAEMVLVKGTRQTLNNLAPRPPGPPPPAWCMPVGIPAAGQTQPVIPAPPGGIPQPSPAYVAEPGIRPPDTGDGGLVDAHPNHLLL